MKPFITSFASSPSTIQRKTILAQDGFTCSLLTLAAGDKASPRASNRVDEHILYAVEGRATVHFDSMNTVLDRDHALRIPRGKTHSISADATNHAKLLRVEVPPRPVFTPEIVTLTS